MTRPKRPYNSTGWRARRDYYLRQTDRFAEECDRGLAELNWVTEPRDERRGAREARLRRRMSRRYFWSGLRQREAHKKGWQTRKASALELRG